MSISLAYRRYVLAPGEAFAVPTVRGALLRVVQGLVWATTSNRPTDTWLAKGEEHQVETSGMTVIEASLPSVVELLPPIPETPRHGPLTGALRAALRWVHEHAPASSIKRYRDLTSGRMP